MYQNQNLGSNPSLKQLVYDNLRDLIIQGKLEPGAKLVEDELAQSMNISRAPVREALNMLERDGFTKIIPRKGAVVTEVNRKDAADIWKCRLACICCLLLVTSPKTRLVMVAIKPKATKLSRSM